MTAKAGPEDHGRGSKNCSEADWQWYRLWWMETGDLTQQEVGREEGLLTEFVMGKVRGCWPPSGKGTGGGLGSVVEPGEISACRREGLPRSHPFLPRRMLHFSVCTCWTAVLGSVVQAKVMWGRI